MISISSPVFALSTNLLPFAIFNISGLLFVAIGFKENIMEMARSGAFIIFVSYVLILSFLIDQFLENKKGKYNDKN